MLSKWLNEYGLIPCEPMDLYRDLFRLGEGYIQQSGEYRQGKNFKGNPIVYINEKAGYKGKMKHYILLEDTFEDQIKEYSQYPSNLLNGCTYFGRHKDKEHIDRIFGIIVDIDDVDSTCMHNFLNAAAMEKYHIYPMPNYVVISKSGEGMHLYYLLEEPLRLFPKTKIQLKELKYALTGKLWNGYTSTNKAVQYQSYDQSFMIVGTKAEDGSEFDVVKAFKWREDRWNVSDLLDYVPEQIVFTPNELWEESKYTLSEAKEKFPEWYEKVIEKGEKAEGHWTCKKDLYDWWLRKVEEGAAVTYGHRYWYVMMLVIYAIKCGVPLETVRKDAFNLIPTLNSIKPDEPFTKADVKAALDCYESRFATFPIRDISKLSGIPIQRNKRNYRTQETHLKMARAIRDISQEEKGTKWNGRKPKKDIVQEWRKDNPEGKKIDCSRDTGLSRPTVYKWWNV